MKLCVADKSQLFRALIIGHLADHGLGDMGIAEADNVATMLERFAEAPADVLVLSMNLLESHNDLIGMMRVRHPRCKVILYESDDYRMHEHLRVEKYLPSSSDPGQLIEAVLLALKR